MGKVLDKAICFATEKHAGSFRKGTDIPYIVHPLEAIAIVATITNDDEVLAAAALHDVVEDTDVTIDDVRREFGERVAKLVSAESEDKCEDLPPESTWKERKKETIDYLVGRASREEQIIALGDKLSNMRAIYRDYIADSDELWMRFNQHDMRMHGWYYWSMVKALSDLDKTVAYQEFVDLVYKVFLEHAVLKSKKCPHCGRGLVPIVYGDPTVYAIEEWERGEISLGGCCIRDDEPRYHCNICDEDFTNKSLKQKKARRQKEIY